MKCKKCGREIGNKKFCGYCGKKNNGENKLIVASILVSAVTILIFVMIFWISPKVTVDMFKINLKSLFCEHEWIDATCNHPKTCDLCGKEEGVQLAHSWKPANCSAPVTCGLCGEEYGQPVDHKWTEVSCTVPKTCVWCSKTEGEALGHKWQEATHTAAKRCLTCGYRPGCYTIVSIDSERGEERVSIDGFNVYPEIFAENVHNCAELKLWHEARTGDDEKIEGAFRFYVRNLENEWFFVSEFESDGEYGEHKILFGYDNLTSFSAFAILPPKNFSGSYLYWDFCTNLVTIK